MSQNMTCITCPIGCALVVERDQDGGITVGGNRCPRGAAYAREELLSPKRTVTATLRLARAGGEGPGAGPARRVPCRTLAAFPRERVGELLSALYSLEVEAPVRRGEVLLKDALGTGIDVVATRTMA